MVWPFGRKKRKGKPKARDGSRPDNARARKRKQEMAKKRARTGKGRSRQGGSRARRVQDRGPATLEEVEPWHRAPVGPVVWQWVKRAPPGYFVGAWHEPNPYGFEDYRRWPRAAAPRSAGMIRRHILEMILEAGRSQWPQEFAGLLRAEDGVIEELVLLPGTIAGDTHAIFQFHMMPSDPGIVGTIHSHPNPIPYPSAADTELFRGHGRVHIIACHPFRENDWNAFNERSYKIELKVVD